MRDEIKAALNDAIKARESRRVTTLRLINAAITDRDIAARGQAQGAVSDEDLLAVLQKMVKQREESAAIYEKAGRADLLDQERAEIEIIREFLPVPLEGSALEDAINAAIAETQATGLRDMGKVVGMLKAKYPGRIDFGEASKKVKVALG